MRTAPELSFTSLLTLVVYFAFAGGLAGIAVSVLTLISVPLASGCVFCADAAAIKTIVSINDFANFTRVLLCSTRMKRAAFRRAVGTPRGFRRSAAYPATVRVGAGQRRSAQEFHVQPVPGLMNTAD